MHKQFMHLASVTHGYTNVAESLEQALQNIKTKGHVGALLHISIDNVPMVISGLGGGFAHDMMLDVCRQLRKFLPEQSEVIHSDRSTIHVVLVNIPSAEIEDYCRDIYKAIQSYGCLMSRVPIQLSSTLGGVVLDGETTSAEEAINKAYVACNDAKDMHKHHMLYSNSESHEVESKNQMILANYIQAAFLSEKLCLAYQPIVNSITGEADYYECLLRIIEEDGSVTSAGPFIPIAERMGFIEMLDGMTLQMAVKELIRYPSLCLSLNVSNVTISSSDWLSLAIKLLSERQIASRLIVEITETGEAHDVKKINHFISIVQSLGCKVALDDFGSGYTSFKQLKALPVDIIKIDGSFIRNINENDDNRFFVETLLALSRNFGLKSVAEFVENRDIADTISHLGVDCMQGNYFSPAITDRLWLE